MVDTATAAKPTEDQIEKALRLAQGFAVSASRGMCGNLREAALDSATDAIMWAFKHWAPSSGGFEAFAASVVRTWIPRTITQERRRFAASPAHVELREELAAPALKEHDDGRDFNLPESIQRLPDELRDLVRLFYVDRFTLRECALLFGIGPETARVRLKRAAELLAGEDTHLKRIRRSNEKRMIRG